MSSNVADPGLQAQSSGSSPIKRTRQSSSNFESSTSPDFASNRRDLVNEMKGSWVGPMPVKEFIEEFVPLSKGTLRPPQRPKLFGELADQTLEKDMYAPFIKLVEKFNLVPGFTIIDTSSHPDLDSRQGKKIKPDPSMYRTEDVSTTKVTQFDKMELHFEFKLHHDRHDPFCDPDDEDDPLTSNFESETKHGRDCRGQLTSYSAEWCSRQHRTFAFSVLILGSYARLILWDRSAVVVTTKFNYKEDSQTLINFLWRFAHLDDAGRGKDTTVRKANTAEIAIAKLKLDPWKPTNTRDVIVFRVQDGEKQQEFIGWGSMADAESLTGRATRAYPVCDKEGGEVRFLKDSWRGAHLEKESDILRELNHARVRNVPTLLCGGDVAGYGHVTRSYEFSGKGTDEPNDLERMPWKCGMHKIIQRIHHRFVEDFVGVHLEKFATSKKMMKAIYDAFVGHQDALQLCGILHRDVSARNVMMTKDGNGGVLNDWDLAKRVVKFPQIEVSRGFERTGTWQFISAFNLMYPGKVHLVQDDIESFFYVVLYHALRYMKHSLAHGLRNKMIRIFDDYSVDDGIATGGQGKRLLSLDHEAILGEDFDFVENPPMMSWFLYAIGAVGEWQRHEKSIRRPGAQITAEMPLGDISHLIFKDHTALEAKWEEVLQLSNWPADDPAIDQLPDNFQPSSSKRGRSDLDDDLGSNMSSKKMKSKGSQHKPSQRSRLQQSFTGRT